MSQGEAILYVVATPIGNLADLSQRARELLASVDIVAAEDTRHTAGLLNHLGIQANTMSLHEHNEAARSQQLVERLQQGDSIALVSDAGTPLISDPGFRLVNEVAAAGFAIVPIPGASAVITALSVAGLPTDRFTFIGFLPSKNAAREKAMSELKRNEETLVFYEAGRRMKEFIDSALQAFGGARAMVIARELTKLHEQIYRGTISECAQWIIDDDNHQRGEFVVMIAGAEPCDSSDAIDAEELLRILLNELSVKQSAALAAKILGKPKNELYQMALELKNKGD